MIIPGLIAFTLLAGSPEGDRRAADSRWLRSTVESDSAATLELASRRYRASNPDEADVWLIGVSHIGDAAFYRAVLELADTTDLVLYESVMPAITMTPPHGDDDEARRASSQAALEWLARQVPAVAASQGRSPASMDELRTGIGTVDRRLVDAVRTLDHDGWDRPVVLRSDNDNRTVLISLGADGQPGGEGIDADLEVPVETEGVGTTSQGIQEAMARGLKLDYQLTALPYEREDWVVSDMDWETLSDRFAASGVDLGGLSGMLEGTSLPAGIAKAMLRVLPLFDAVSGGAMTDGAKVMMVELLGREDMVNLAMSQMGADAGRILIEDRNAVVMEDLTQRASAHPSISILYGAGHMKDFDTRLRAAGYQPTETTWLPAISVDLTESRLTSLHLSMLRRAVASAAAQIEAQARNRNQ